MREITFVRQHGDSSEDTARHGGSPKPVCATCSNCLRRKTCPLTSTSHAGTPLTEAIFESESELFSGNDHFDRIYVLKSGSLQVSVTNPKGGQSILGFIFPGEVVGWEFWKLCNFPYTVETLESSRLCSMEKKSLLHTMRISPDFQSQFLRAVGHQVMRDKIKPLAMHRGSIEAKTAAFILDIYSRNHRDKHIGQDLLLSMPRSAISSYLGISPESLSRGLSTLGKKQAISVFNRRISILDMKLLNSLASN